MQTKSALNLLVHNYRAVLKKCFWTNVINRRDALKSLSKKVNRSALAGLLVAAMNVAAPVTVATGTAAAAVVVVSMTDSAYAAESSATGNVVTQLEDSNTIREGEYLVYDDKPNVNTDADQTDVNIPGKILLISKVDGTKWAGFSNYDGGAGTADNRNKQLYFDGVTLTGDGNLAIFGFTGAGGRNASGFQIHLDELADVSNFTGKITAFNAEGNKATQVHIGGDKLANVEFVFGSSSNVSFTKGTDGTITASNVAYGLFLNSNASIGGITGTNSNEKEFVEATADNLTLTLGGSGTYTFAGKFGIDATYNDSGDGGIKSYVPKAISITKTGTGTQTLSGENYLGNLTISNGTLNLSGTNDIAGPLSMMNGTINFSGTNDIAGLLSMMNGTINLSGTSVIAGETSIMNGQLTTSGTTTFKSNLSVGYGGSATLSLGGNVTINSAITVNPGGILVFNEGVVITVEGVAGVTPPTDTNGYASGNTKIYTNNGGTIKQGETTIESDKEFTLNVNGSNVTVKDGVATIEDLTTYYLNTGSATYSTDITDKAALTTVEMASGTTFNLDQADAPITAKFTGAGKLQKTGDGTIELSSGESNFTGGTDIDAGCLKITNKNALGGNGTITIKQGTTLELATNVSDTTYQYVLDGGTIKSTVATTHGEAQIAAGDAITLNDNSTIQTDADMGMIASQHAANTLKLNEHTLIKSGAGSFWLSNTTITAGTIDITAGNITLVGTYDSDGSAADFKLSGGNLNLSGKNFSVKSLSGTVATSSVILGSGTLTIVGTDDNTQTHVYAGTITGAGSIVKNGPDTLELTGANVYTGTTTINAGTLKVSGNGTLGTGIIKIDADAVLELNKDIVISSRIEGTDGDTASNCGKIKIAEGKTVEFKDSPNGNFKGIFEVGKGATLKAGANTNTVPLGGGTIQLADNATVEFATGATSQFNGTITGTGSMKVSGGILSVGGENENTFSGGTTIEAGAMLTANKTTALGMGSVTNNGMLTLNAEGTYANAIVNDGILNISQVAILSGALTGSGTLNINANTELKNASGYSGIVVIGDGQALTVGTILNKVNGGETSVYHYNGAENPTITLTQDFTFAGTLNNKGTAQDAVLTVSTTDAQTMNFSIGEGWKSFKKTGAGNMTVSSEKLKNIDVQIAEGTLTLNTGNAISEMIAKTITIDSNATLALGQETDIAGLLTGEGNINLNGQDMIISAGGTLENQNFDATQNGGAVYVVKGSTIKIDGSNVVAGDDTANQIEQWAEEMNKKYKDKQIEFVFDTLDFDADLDVIWTASGNNWTKLNSNLRKANADSAITVGTGDVAVGVIEIDQYSGFAKPFKSLTIGQNGSVELENGSRFGGEEVIMQGGLFTLKHQSSFDKKISGESGTVRIHHDTFEIVDDKFADFSGTLQGTKTVLTVNGATLNAKLEGWNEIVVGQNGVTLNEKVQVFDAKVSGSGTIISKKATFIGNADSTFTGKVSGDVVLKNSKLLASEGATLSGNATIQGAGTTIHTIESGAALTFDMATYANAPMLTITGSNAAGTISLVGDSAGGEFVVITDGMQDQDLEINHIKVGSIEVQVGGEAVSSESYQYSAAMQGDDLVVKVANYVDENGNLNDAFNPSEAQSSGIQSALSSSLVIRDTLANRTMNTIANSPIRTNMVVSSDLLDTDTMSASNGILILGVDIDYVSTSVWGEALYSHAEYDGSNAENKLKENSYGGMIGIERAYSDLNYGMFVGAISSKVDADAGSELEGESIYLGGYAGMRRGIFIANFGAMGGYSMNETSRYGVGGHELTGDYDSYMINFFAEAGVYKEFSEAVYARATAGIQYAYVNAEDYEEDGFGGAEVDACDFDALTASLDARLGYRFNRGFVEARAGVAFELLDTEIESTFSIVDNPAALFSSQGGELDRTKFILGLDAGYYFTTNFEVRAGGLFEFGEENQRVTGNIRLIYTF